MTEVQRGALSLTVMFLTGLAVGLLIPYVLK